MNESERDLSEYRFDLSGYAEEIKILAKLGIHSKMQVGFAVSCCENGFRVVYQNGKIKYTDRKSKVRMKFMSAMEYSPHIRIVTSDLVMSHHKLPVENIERIKELQVLLDPTQLFVMKDILADCCKVYDAHEKMLEVVADIPVHKDKVKRRKI